VSYEPFVRIFPFPVHNSEGDVFIWWTSAKMEENRFFIPWLFYNFIRRCFGFIDEIRVENVELRIN
jgi:hypothetical protein